MSNIYNTEPSTEGKILLHTSFGDLDVELWPQQAPKACRNFIQLCLEGYYDNTVFHRLIADFMIQGGDPTGSGNGGESIYGAPFIDEPHSRLRFNHRGLLAMANENKPNTNHSQFFFTLGACEFLQNKHTIFGKITGNTIYNLLAVNGFEIDTTTDRPVHPPRLTGSEVLWNPFDDIIPREIVTKVPTETVDKKPQVQGNRDTNLLSFQDDDEIQKDCSLQLGSVKENEKKTMHSSHDVLQDPKLKKKVDPVLESLLVKRALSKKSVKTKSALEKLKEKAASKSAAPATEDTINMTNESGQIDVKSSTNVVDSGEDKATKKSNKRPRVQVVADEYTQLREQLRKSHSAAPVAVGTKAAKESGEQISLRSNKQNWKKLRAKRQDKTLKRVQDFRRTLAIARAEAQSKLLMQKDAAPAPATNTEKEEGGYHGQLLEQESDHEEKTFEPDSAWMTSKLKFKKHIDDQYRSGQDPNIDNYVTIDTRRNTDK